MLRARHFFCEKVGRCEGCRARKPVPYFRLKTVILAPCGEVTLLFRRKSVARAKYPLENTKVMIAKIFL